MLVPFGSRRASSTSRHGLHVGAVIAGLLVLAGCSSSHSSQAASTTRETAKSPNATTSAVASSTSSVDSSAPTATTVPTPPTSSAAPVAAPTLGQLAGTFAKGKGFGQVKSSEIDNGGDPTGLVTHVVWKSWGGAEAVGTGTSEYVGSNQTVAQGTEEPVTVIAFSSGTCSGKVMYRAVEWYFSQHGQTFQPGRYEDICRGTYVGNP